MTQLYMNLQTRQNIAQITDCFLQLNLIGLAPPDQILQAMIKPEATQINATNGKKDFCAIN